MAAIDALAFPEKGRAYRVYGTFLVVSTQKESSGALTALAAVVAEDDGAYASTINAAVQVGTSGRVYVDLTLAEVGGNFGQVKFTSSLSGVNDVIVPFNPLEFESKEGRGTTRFEEVIRKVGDWVMNRHVDEGVTYSVKCDDDVTDSLTGTVTESEVVAERGKLT